MESSGISSENLKVALNSLPSCIRCRERRVGCDRQLPRCQACVAVGKECEQNDLGTRVSRGTLQALHLRLQQLEAIEARVAPQLKARAAFAAADAVCSSQPTNFLASDSPSFSDGPTPAAGSSHSPSFPQEQTKVRNDLMNKWGPSSAAKHLRLVGILLGIRLSCPFHQVVQFQGNVPILWAPHTPAGDARSQLPPIETAKFLMEFYYQCVDRFQPILGRTDGDRDLERLYAGSGSPKSYRSCTRAQLALAIAARCLFRAQGEADQSQSYLHLSDSMFDAAISSLRLVFQDSNSLLEFSSSAFENEEAHAMAKLQIVLLMVCYVLFVPSKGNIWQLLGFAERLWQGIKNARAQLRRLNIEASRLAQEQPNSRLEPNLLYTSFISLERMVGMAYGRPIDFLDFAEDDEPSYGPDDSDVPALHAQILVVRQHVHSAFLSSTGPQESRRGILSSIDKTPSPGSLEWYSAIRSSAQDWFKRWQDMVQHMSGVSEDTPGDRYKDFLLLSGAKFRDETLHLAFCLLLQKTADLDSENQTVQGDPVQSSAFASNSRPVRRPHTVLPPDVLAEGRGIVHRLISHLTHLLRHVFYTSNPPSLKNIPLVFPRTWIADIELFRVGITAAYLSRCPLNNDERSSGRLKGRELDLTWEVTSCIKLLSQTSAEINTEGLTEAILALVGNDGDSIEI